LGWFEVGPPSEAEERGRGRRVGDEEIGEGKREGKREGVGEEGGGEGGREEGRGRGKRAGQPEAHLNLHMI